MKITLGLGAIGAVLGQMNLAEYSETGKETGNSIERLTEKRYQQLTTQMNFYNANFDARRFWAYGCNCLILGDRPMSDPGLGPPVDALDNSCKQYKDCLKCAAMTYGETCKGELVKYKFYAKGDDVKCRNRLDTCERSLCECDKLLARTHSAVVDSFDIKYHLFWGNFRPEDTCPHSNPRVLKPVRECCNTHRNGQAFVLYNVDRQECCAHGEVANIGEC